MNRLHQCGHDGFLLLVWIMLISVLPAQPVLRDIGQIKALSSAEADRDIRAEIEGVVTHLVPKGPGQYDDLVTQQKQNGIYISLPMKGGRGIESRPTGASDRPDLARFFRSRCHRRKN